MSGSPLVSSASACGERFRFTRRDQVLGSGGDSCRHLVERAGRIDDDETPRRRRRQGQETITHPAMERGIEVLESGHVVGRLSPETDLDRQVQEDREVGHEPVGGHGLEGAKAIQGHAGAVALIGERRIGVPSAQDGPARFERRPQHFDHELAAGGIEQNASVNGSVAADGPVRARRSSRTRSPIQVPPHWLAREQSSYTSRPR